MAKDFLKELSKRPLVFDGATGTMLQRLGLKAGGCPDELALTEPDMVRKVHQAYVDVGSDIITTNTFGGSRIKLKEYGLGSPEKVRELNIAAARIAKEVAGKDVFVAGCLGPTGKFLRPVGELEFDETLDVFTEQAAALKEGGADLFLIETVMDVKELRAATIAAKEVGLPVVATMTFDETMRTVLGTSPEAFAVTGSALGLSALGANCSLGVEGIYKALEVMSRYTTVPLMAQPNAGLPVLKDGETIFPATPEEMANYVPRFVSVGVRILGGCCGTTPEHIQKMGADFKALKTEKQPKKNFNVISSRSAVSAFGGDNAALIIGERINPTGRKKFAAEIKEEKIKTIRTEAREQTEAGATALDVNVGVPDIDEVAAMKRAVFCVSENSILPIVVDSSDIAALEEGLKSVDGKPLINSVSGEEAKLDSVLPLAKRYGAALIGLALDDDGIPKTAEGRLKVAEKILKRAEKIGIPKEDLIIDCLAMTISAEPDSANETLRAIKLIREELGLSTALGVSNISFGLPSRATVNSNFFSMALAHGLDAAIVNPKNEMMMDAYHASMVLLNKDDRAEGYIERFRDKSGNAAAPTKTKKEEPKDIRSRLARAIVEGDEGHIVDLVDEALTEGLSPLEVSNEGLIIGLNEVGVLFGSNRYFLPQVILSADTMKKAFTRLKKEMKESGEESLGKVIMATVQGDIHDIGKNIVATLLENHGFEVIDLGKSVPTEKIVEEALRSNVDVVGLSALMTTTVMEMDNVLKKLKEAGARCKTIVGGAVVTPEFAKKIGADEFGGEATVAVERIKKLVKV